MIRNILGDWGSNLDDDDYACALAALGVLESSGAWRQRPRSDADALVSALEDEFALGDRTPVWRYARHLDVSTTNASGDETVHADPAAMANAWHEFRRRVPHERALPRIAVPLDWRERGDVLQVDDLCAWLQRADGLNALVLAKLHSGPDAVAWHWPLRVGVPDGPEHASILEALRQAQRQVRWAERLARCFTVGTARDACDLLILSSSAAPQMNDRLLARIRASFVVCLEDSPPDLAHAGDRYRELRERLGAAGVAAVGRFDDPLHERVPGSWTSSARSRTTCRSTPRSGVWVGIATIERRWSSAIRRRSTRAASWPSPSATIASSRHWPVVPATNVPNSTRTLVLSRRLALKRSPLRNLALKWSPKSRPRWHHRGHGPKSSPRSRPEPSPQETSPGSGHRSGARDGTTAVTAQSRLRGRARDGSDEARS